jgi:hypothetical protein
MSRSIGNGAQKLLLPLEGALTGGERRLLF